MICNQVRCNLSIGPTPLEMVHARAVYQFLCCPLGDGITLYGQWCDLNQIKAPLLRRRQRLLDGHDSQLLPVRSDHPQGTDANLPIHTGARRLIVCVFECQVLFSSAKRQQRIPDPESAVLAHQVYPRWCASTSVNPFPSCANRPLTIAGSCSKQSTSALLCVASASPAIRLSPVRFSAVSEIRRLGSSCFC